MSDEPQTLLTTLWGTARRRMVVAAAAFVVVVAVVVTVVVTGSGDSRPVPSGSLPTLGSQFATPPVSVPSSTRPAQPASLPAYGAEPMWTITVPADAESKERPTFAITGNGYVLKENKRVRGLDRAGNNLWTFTPPEVDYFTVRVAGTVVFVAYDNPDEDRWPQPDLVIALDAATGAELWRDGEASLWAASADTLYMSVCYGGQNNRIGDCKLSARDPRTNRIRWSVATYASSRVENLGDDLLAAATPPYLLVGAYPANGSTYDLSALDPAGGRTLGRGFEDGDGHTGALDSSTGQTVVGIRDSDENPADGCTAPMAGYSRSGDRIWEFVARTAKLEDGKRCSGAPGSVNNGRLGVTGENGVPSVLNVDTGVVEWSGPAKGDAIAASDTMLLTVESSADKGRELVAYRVGNAQPVWRAPFFGTVSTSRVTITAAQVAVVDSGGSAVGYARDTGQAWTYGDGVSDSTPTWFAVCAGGTCRGYPIT